MFIYSSNTGLKSETKPAKSRLKKVTKESAKAKKSPFVSEHVDVQPKVAIKDNTFADTPRVAAENDIENNKKPLFNYIQMIVFAVVIGALGFMYLAHVRKTNQLFEQRNQLLLKYESTQHKVEELQRKYERIISPSEIHEKAIQAGFEAPKAKDLFIEK
jgi:cell division protein FtsL